MALSSNFSIVGDVHGGVVCSDVDEDTDVKLLLLIDKADVSSRREIESRTSESKILLCQNSLLSQRTIFCSFLAYLSYPNVWPSLDWVDYTNFCSSSGAVIDFLVEVLTRWALGWILKAKKKIFLQCNREQNYNEENFKVAFNLPVTFSSEDFFEIGEVREFSFCSDVESALVNIALLTRLFEMVSALIGDVFSPSEDSCLRLRYSFIDNCEIKRFNVSQSSIIAK